jgi:hypothetical protein
VTIETERPDVLAELVLVGGDADDASVGEGGETSAEVVDAFEEGVDDDGFEGVQLQLSGLGGKGDGHVVSDDLEGDLVHDLGDDRVHLAGHD